MRKVIGDRRFAQGSRTFPEIGFCEIDDFLSLHSNAKKIILVKFFFPRQSRKRPKGPVPPLNGAFWASSRVPGTANRRPRPPPGDAGVTKNETTAAADPAEAVFFARGGGSVRKNSHCEERSDAAISLR